MKLAALLRVITIGLCTLYIVISGIFTLQHWQNYRHYQLIDEHVLFIQSAIKLIDSLSDERAYLNILLGKTTESKTELSELTRRQEATNIAIDRLSTRIPLLTSPNKAQFYRSFEQWLIQVKHMRRITEQTLSVSPVLRTSTQIQQLVQANIQLPQSIENMLQLASDNIVQQDGQYIHAIETLNALTILRNQAGLLGSTLIPSIIAQRTLTTEEKTFFYQTKYLIQQKYAALNHHLSWLIKSGTLLNQQNKKNMDKKYVQFAFPILDYLFLIGKQSGQYHMTSKDFTEQYAGHLDSAKKLRYVLLQEQLASTEEMKQYALTKLMCVLGLILMIGIMLTYCLRTLSTRFFQPITEAVDLLVLPDEALYKRTLLPAYKRRDEASKMLLKIHALRTKIRVSDMHD